jgi:ribokinase
MYDVITSGSATIDAFIQTGNKLFRGADGAVSVPFGSKIVVDDIVFAVGGGGTTTAIAFSKFGLKAAFLGKIGLGTNSERVIKELKKDGVDTSLVRKGKDRTGFSVVLDAYKRDRTILTFKGSNDKLCYSEVPLDKLKTRWFYFCSMMNESFKTIEKLSAWARKRNIDVMFNPSSYLASKGIRFLGKLISNSRIIVMNLEEARILLGNHDVKKLLAKLHSHGPEIAIITDGPNGVHLLRDGYYYRVRPHRIRVVETTGAGDAFGAGFLAGFIKTDDIEFSLRLGLITAEKVIQTIGSKHNLPGWDDAMQTMRRISTPVARQKL